jgi:hypothetical protein
MRTGLVLSAEAARWALRCYARHFWLVFGLSIVPTGQRFVAVRFGDDLPAAVGIAGEVLTGVARALLVFLVLRIAVRDAGLAGLSVRDRWQRFAAGLEQRRWDFVTQFLVVGIAFAVFDLLPMAAVSLWVPADRQEIVNAVLVSVKNPTVIAVTILWMIGIGYHLMVVGDRSIRSSADRAGQATGGAVV